MTKSAWLVVLLLLSSPAAAQTIDNLGAASGLAGTESVPVFQSANPAKRTTAQAIANLSVISAGCSAAVSSSNPPLTISTAKLPTTLSAANAPILATYCGGIENLTQASNDAPTIAGAGTAGFPIGWFTTLCNVTNNTKTITPAAGTIGGAATKVIPAGSTANPQCLNITSNGVSDYIVDSGSYATSTGLVINTTPITGGTTGDILTVSGSATLADSGIVAASLAPIASPSFTGSVTIPVTGSIQCLHVSSLGAITGTGSDCGFVGSIAAGSTVVNSVTTGHILDVSSGVLHDSGLLTSNVPLLNGNNVLTAAGAASSPNLLINGAIFTGGSGTTTFPNFLIQPTTATASTVWNSTGTAFGINAHTGIGNLIDIQQDGVSRFIVSSSSGSVTLIGNITSTGGSSIFTVGASGQFAFTGRGIVTSKAAGSIQFGAQDAAAPVAQTLSVQSVVAGQANTAGAAFTIAGSKSNGTGGGDVVLQTTLSNAASGTQNTLATAVTFKGGNQQSNFGGIISPQNSFTPTAGSGAASVAGNDQTFVVTAGTAQTSITANFGHTWTAAPVCAISTNSTASVVDVSSVTTTAITFGASVALTGALINVLCFGT